MSELTTGIVVGVVIAGFIGFLGYIIYFAFNTQWQKKYNIFIPLRVKTGGQDSFIMLRGFIDTDPVLGSCIKTWFPSDKNYKVLPNFGKKYMFSLQKMNHLLYPLTDLNNTFAPEYYVGTEKRVVDRIDLNTGLIVSEEKEVSIIKPLKQSMRQTALELDRQIADMTGVKPSFWEQNKYLIGGVVIFGISALLCVAAMYMAYSYNTGVFDNPPTWLKDLLATVTELAKTAPLTPPPA
jgi:hypothetical protein